MVNEISEVSSPQPIAHNLYSELKLPVKHLRIINIYKII